MIPKGKQVTIEYSLYLEDGSCVATNIGKSPLVFRYGANEILPELEVAIGSLSTGEQKRVRLEPDSAFGPVDDAAFQEVEENLVPEHLRDVGNVLIVEDEKGNPMQIRIHEKRGDKLVLDFNHPLAGQTVVFDVKVLEIR